MHANPTGPRTCFGTRDAWQNAGMSTEPVEDFGSEVVSQSRTNVQTVLSSALAREEASNDVSGPAGSMPTTSALQMHRRPPMERTYHVIGLARVHEAKRSGVGSRVFSGQSRCLDSVLVRAKEVSRPFRCSAFRGPRAVWTFWMQTTRFAASISACSSLSPCTTRMHRSATRCSIAQHVATLCSVRNAEINRTPCDIQHPCCVVAYQELGASGKALGAGEGEGGGAAFVCTAGVGLRLEQDCDDLMMPCA